MPLSLCRVARGLAVVLILSSCARAPDSYPPPAQFAMPEGPEPPLLAPDPMRAMLAMSDSDIDSHILQDVAPATEGDEWRWTGQHPRFRLMLRERGWWRFHMRFRLADTVMQEIGAVTLTISINGKVLGRPRYTAPGPQEYTYLVDRVPPNPVILAVDVDPPWIGPDQAKLGILLHSIGFERP